MGARVPLLWGLPAVLCWAQQEPMQQREDPMQLLSAIRHKVAAGVRRLPRYLCTETVERKSLARDFGSRPPEPISCGEVLAAAPKLKKKLQVYSTDRLRLDVAIAQDGEMYSWVGEGKFEEGSLGDLVKEGATSTGTFGSFLHAVFVTDVATFSFQGEKDIEGKRVLEYSFQVPLWRSGYQVVNRTKRRVMGYSGSFVADAKTLDLLRLEIRTDPLAEDVDICQAITTMDYTQVRMNNLDFLLPSEVDMRIVNTDGSENQNRTEFTGCHQFLGESKLIFDEQQAGNAPQIAAKPKDVTLPAGVGISVELADPIDPAKAAAGDPVTGRLTQQIKQPVNGLLLARGTKLNGRIFELRSSYGLGTSLELGLKWESIEVNGAKYPVDLSAKAAVRSSVRGVAVRMVWPAAFADPVTHNPDAGYFVFPGVWKHYQIPAGFEAEWVTRSAALLAK